MLVIELFKSPTRTSELKAKLLVTISVTLFGREGS